MTLSSQCALLARQGKLANWPPLDLTVTHAVLSVLLKREKDGIPLRKRGC